MISGGRPACAVTDNAERPGDVIGASRPRSRPRIFLRIGFVAGEHGADQIFSVNEHAAEDTQNVQYHETEREVREDFVCFLVGVRLWILRAGMQIGRASCRERV